MRVTGGRFVNNRTPIQSGATVSGITKVTIETVAVELYNDDDDIKEDQCNSECVRERWIPIAQASVCVYVGGEEE